jgi:hypothetical protein
MAVALSSNELERTIEVLSSAAQTLQLTRFERLSYRALLVCVDLAMASFVALMPFAFFIAVSRLSRRGGEESLPLGFELLILVFYVSLLVGIVSLALNIPLLRKTFREERRLKRLGLSSLSKSLWKESRRRRWMSRFRGVLLIGLGIIFLLSGVGMGGAVMLGKTTRGEQILYFSLGALLYAVTAGLLFAARYLRNQRERMDLAASARELRTALQSLRQRKGHEVISVPAELLEQTAIIESAQITKERKDAVLQSAAFRPNAYAIAFNRDAAEQRATLDVADRVELEDLVAELSTNGAQLETQAEAIPGTKGATLRGTTESKHVEVKYVIDHASRGIRVIAVRHGGEASHASLNGASHA